MAWSRSWGLLAACWLFSSCVEPPPVSEPSSTDAGQQLSPGLPSKDSGLRSPEAGPASSTTETTAFEPGLSEPSLEGGTSDSATTRTRTDDTENAAGSTGNSADETSSSEGDSSGLHAGTSADGGASGPDAGSTDEDAGNGAVASGCVPGEIQSCNDCGMQSCGDDGAWKACSGAEPAVCLSELTLRVCDTAGYHAQLACADGCQQGPESDHCFDCGECCDNTDCRSDEVCSGGECVCDPARECCTNAECGENRYCSQSGTCTCPGLECQDECRLNAECCTAADCGSNQHCDGQGHCVCDRACGNRCLAPGECCESAECPGSQVCESYSCTCTTECCQNSDCGPNEVCSGGSCTCASGFVQCGSTCIEEKLKECEPNAGRDSYKIVTGFPCALNTSSGQSYYTCQSTCTWSSSYESCCRASDTSLPLCPSALR